MATYSARWLAALLLAMALLAASPLPARAGTAVLFNGGAVAGCTYAAASTTYTCPPFASSLDVTIASGYKVVLTGPMDFDYNQQLNMSGSAQLQVAGNLDIGGIKTSNLNITGGSLVSSGQFSMGAQVQTIVANISAASMKIGTGSDTKVTGTLTATGQIDIASHATIIGPITGGKVTTGSPVALTGNVTASVSFNLSSGSTLNGNLVSPVVSLDASPSRVNGNVTASTSLTIASASSVNGNVVAGAVVLQSSEAYITGTALVDSLKLDWHGRVQQAVTCRNGTSGSPCNCVDDQSGYKNTPSETVCVAPVNNNTVHHYQITHDGSGLTCQPENVTVKACANAACTTLYNGTAQVRLTPNSVESPAPLFSLANGSGSAYVRQTTAGAATLAIASATPTATAATTCIGGATATPCGTTFAAEGFKVSGDPRLAGESAAFTVEALKADLATPSSCVPLIANSTKPVTMRCAYRDPASNSNTLSRNVNLASNTGSGIATATLVCGSNTFNNAASASLQLKFDANGKAAGTMAYDDVGALALSAEYTAGDAYFITAASNDILVAPHHYGVDSAAAPAPGGGNAISNPAATSATGPVFTRAGTAFSVRVTALSKNNIVSTNFGRESAPARFRLTHQQVDPAPLGGYQGALSVPNVQAFADAISAGSANTTGRFVIGSLAWDEVGIMRLTAWTEQAGLYKDLGKNFLEKGTVDSPANGNIGRFIPDHFDTAITGPDTAPVMACPAAGVFPIACAGNRFIYATQPFGLTVSAMNGAGAVTKNYAGGYARAVTISARNAAGAAGTIVNPEYQPKNNAATGTAAGLPSSASAMPAATFVAGAAQGSISYDFSKNFGNALALNTISRPINVFFRAEEPANADGVTSLRGAASVEAGIAVVAGRLQVAHSYGSELLKRRVEVESQYWTGTEFLRNTADATEGTTVLTDTGVLLFGSCTKGLNAGGSCYAGLAADSTPDKLSFKDNRGRSWLRLNAPGAGRNGSVLVRVNAFPWLPSTAGVLTYGVYRSPVIYLRELY